MEKFAFGFDCGERGNWSIQASGFDSAIEAYEFAETHNYTNRIGFAVVDGNGLEIDMYREFLLA